MSENSNPQLHIAVCDDDPIDRQQAAALRELGDSTAIIFISSNRDMALRGYEVSAARYLAKPLRTVLSRIMRKFGLQAHVKMESASVNADLKL